MLQKEVAERIGVDKTTVCNWEANSSGPEVRYMPAIIQFLGYNPLPAAATDGWAVRLVNVRTALGLSQKEAARQIGIDPGTLAKWERGTESPKATCCSARGDSSRPGKLRASDVPGRRRQPGTAAVRV
jgi:DNA-binding XRE family transcriptional regulator